MALNFLPFKRGPLGLVCATLACIGVGTVALSLSGTATNGLDNNRLLFLVDKAITVFVSLTKVFRHAFGCLVATYLAVFIGIHLLKC